MKLNWNVLGGGGVQNKNPPWKERGYFLDLHNTLSYIASCYGNCGVPVAHWGSVHGSPGRVLWFFKCQGGGQKSKPKKIPY